MYGQLAAQHSKAIGIFESVLSSASIRIQHISIVVFLERALDYLTETCKQIVYLTLSACEWKICDIKFCGYDHVGR